MILFHNCHLFCLKTVFSKKKQKRVIIFIVITSPFLIGSNNLIVPKQQVLATFGWRRQYTHCWVIARYLIATFLSGSGAADKPFMHEWTKNDGERLYCYRKKEQTAICLKVNGRNARIRKTYCSMYFLRSICKKKNLFVFSMFSYIWVPWSYEKPKGGRAPRGWQMPNPRVASKFANAPPRKWQSAKTASIRLGR